MTQRQVSRHSELISQTHGIFLLTEKADPILQQVSLARNPACQFPRPITLETNYAKLLPSLNSTVVPPKMKLSKVDLEGWIKETTELKEKRLQVLNGSDQSKFQRWLRDQQKKVAPGYTFDSSIMLPNKPPTNTKDASLQRHSSQGEQREASEAFQDKREVNELDEIFGRTTI